MTMTMTGIVLKGRIKQHTKISRENGRGESESKDRDRRG